MVDYRPQARIAVVGGGVSGIATAYFLKRMGYEPELIEAASSLGGRAGSARLQDKTIDIGGKNIGRRYTLFRQFIADHGSLPLEFFGINSSTIRNGALHTIDSQKRLKSLYHLLRLVGLEDFGRLLSLAGLVRHNPAEGLLGGPRFSEIAERKDHHPLSHWFGERCVDGFLRPITLRMNGAEPEEYHLGNLGSNLKMVLDRYDQLTHGMAELLGRFEQTVSTVLNTRVVRLLGQPGRITGVEMLRGGKTESRDYDLVVLALPAPLGARLLADEPIADALQKVVYHPVTLIVARYSRPIFDPDIRAIVFGKDTPLSNAGCYGKEDLRTVRYTLSGKRARTIDPSTPPEETLKRAEETLSRFFPVSARERIDYVYRHLPLGLCGYSPYHHRLLREIEAWETRVSGLALTGDYLRGASIESCFHAARECAERVAKKL
uniref:Oxygen-dependent protoporphyrinogen oxidase n=1 Tax=Candidatus Kentrum sp. LFY TaxID=2126342 RepID=A0A450V0C7_9GAMM|nr:MAG: oxygen-dependent protoporphyrinogen oxidase [Candidatus Kentron sp. LFY]